VFVACVLGVGGGVVCVWVDSVIFGGFGCVVGGDVMGYGRAGRPKNAERAYRPTLEAIEAERALRGACRFYRYFPDEGPLRRGLYPKHLAFMAAGREWKQRAALMGNRSGKSDTAAYEITCHMTGCYPLWWRGRVFDKPTEWWAAGDTAGTTRDIIQAAFLGPTSTIETRAWSGMIPRTMVYDVSRKPGVPLAVSTIWVRHASGGISSIDLKSFDQKRESFQGTAKAGCWLDEEPPDDIYSECLMRTMTTDGLMLVTFTPLQGLTPFIASWLERSVVEVLDERGVSQLRPAKSEVFKGVETADVPDESDFVGLEAPAAEKGTRYIVMASWEDAPHLSREQKDAMLLEFPIHQRDARSKGIPALGSGVIYPIPEGDIRVAPFAIPDAWPRCWGLDTDSGAGWTACVWLARDPNANTYYLYDVYKRHHGELSGHIEAIKARGVWIPGVADAAALLVTAHDSQQVVTLYRQAGLDVVLPDKAVEAGISEVLSLFTAGRLKVFASCGAFFEEYRLYRRDGKGRIVKNNDHAVDAVRYACFSGIGRMRTKPLPKDANETGLLSLSDRAQSWLA
jgi:phage terminase large subunit-like protein